jgi:hypothetical protein
LLIIRRKSRSSTRKFSLDRALDASRTDIRSFLTKRFSIEMNLDMISTYKADVARKLANAKKVPPASAENKPAPKPPAKSTSTPIAKKPATPAPPAMHDSVPKAVAKPAAATVSNGVAHGIELDDIRAVKDLVGRVGSASLKTLIDVLVK